MRITKTRGKRKARKTAPKHKILTEVRQDDFLCDVWGRAVLAAPPKARLAHIGTKIVQVSAVMLLLASPAMGQSMRDYFGILEPKAPVKIEYRSHEKQRREPIKVQPVAVMLPKKVKSLTRREPIKITSK